MDLSRLIHASGRHPQRPGDGTELRTRERIREVAGLIQHIVRIQSLDISKEIFLIREIKDVQDELGIMAMLFEDQRKVLVAMENAIPASHGIHSKTEVREQDAKQHVPRGEPASDVDDVDSLDDGVSTMEKTPGTQRGRSIPG